MKKNIYNLLKLFESFSDLFNDDILSDETTGSIDTDLSSRFAENDLKPIVVDLLGIDKPRGWKYEKINNKEVLVHRGRKGSLYPDKVLEDMMDALNKKKFNLYIVSNCPYAFVNNLSFYDGKYKEKESLGLTRRLPPKDSQLYVSGGYLKLEHEYDNWVNKIFPSMPEIVQECFRNDPTYKTILLSEDEGIMLSYQSPSGCGIPYNYNESTFTAILKLTGKVLYDEKDDNNQKDIINKTKDINKRISFLKSRYKKLGTLNVIRDNSFYLDDKNEPYGIVYFNWKRQVNLCQKSKEYNIPTLLIWLLQKNIYPLNDIEKDDDNAVYELTKNGLSFYFYKNIGPELLKQCSSENTERYSMGNKIDSCVIVRLTDETLEYFHDIFD